MMNNPSPFKGLNIRIPIKGRGLINGSGLSEYEECLRQHSQQDLTYVEKIV